MGHLQGVGAWGERGPLRASMRAWAELAQVDFLLVSGTGVMDSMICWGQKVRRQLGRLSGKVGAARILVQAGYHLVE